MAGVGQDVGAHGWLSHGLSGFPSLDGNRIKLVLLEAGRMTTLDSLDRHVPEAQVELLKATEVDPQLGEVVKQILA